MILLNITFACDPSLETEIRSWIIDTYIPEATASGLFSHPLVSKVFPLPDSDAVSFAVQMRCTTVGQANGWLAGTGGSLCATLTSGRNDRVLFFPTIMEIIHGHDA